MRIGVKKNSTSLLMLSAVIDANVSGKDVDSSWGKIEIVTGESVHALVNTFGQENQSEPLHAVIVDQTYFFDSKNEEVDKGKFLFFDMSPVAKLAKLPHYLIDQQYGIGVRANEYELMACVNEAIVTMFDKNLVEDSKSRNIMHEQRLKWGIDYENMPRLNDVTISGQ